MYTPQNVIGYVHEKLPEFFDKGAQLKASELSDGNINFVFRVEDPATGKSLIIKHAEDTLRVNPARHIGFARSRIECEVLKQENIPYTVSDRYTRYMPRIKLPSCE